MRSFESAYSDWMNMHLSKRRGERLRRLKDGHGFGEKLLLQQAWWPAVGNFELLHPEYEFIGSDGNYYFMDFGYERLPKPSGVEVDSFSVHARDVDRDTFSRGLVRQNEIVLSGWNMLRFSIDKLKEDPLHCQRTIVRMLEHWYGEDNRALLDLPLYQREIVRLAMRSTVPVTPEMASLILGKGLKLTRSQLHELVERGWLENVGGDARIRSYSLRNNRK